MKFEQFDRRNLKDLRNEMTAVLKKYGMDANLEFVVGNMSFTETEVEVKVTAKVAGAKSRAEVNLEAILKMRGLVKERDGRRLVRYDHKKHKYPFIFEKTSEPGKLYKMSDDQAEFYFRAA